MTGWRDWAEGYWDVVAMAVSLVCALTVGAILALAFNVVTTTIIDDPRVERADGAPTPVSDARPAVHDSPDS